MFVTNKLKIMKIILQYTCVAYYTNNTKKTLICKADFENFNLSLNNFNEKVIDWNRQGQNMKQIQSKVTPILGYDYFTTPEQHIENMRITKTKQYPISTAPKITCPNCNFKF